MATPEEETQKKTPNFWDSYYAMAFLIIAILFCRFYIFEPFKIPSGSMEPTLFGHEDYGDRIVTNKLAYASTTMVGIALGVSVVLILVGFFASHGARTWRSRIGWALVALASIGGIGFSWAKGAVAGEPKRFDVVVFQYNTDWMSRESQNSSAMHVSESNKKINYIKRLVGLPDEKLVVSGGDLFLRKNGTDEIIRKWEVSPETQKILWYPISKSFAPTLHEKPKKDNPLHDEIVKQLDTLNFPWNGAESATPGVTREPNSLKFDGSAPVTLNYRFPATNIYLKQGRWPFSHENCPEANKEGVKTESGFVMRNPETKSKDITAYVSNTWEGVQCPNCGQIEFPLVPKPSSGPVLEARGSTNFFYGGRHTVNDLRLDLDVNLDAAGGAVQIQVGSSEHSALWNLPISGAGLPAVDTASGKVHPVKKDAPALAAGRHQISLAYVDGTVIATLDGQDFETIKIPVAILGAAAADLKTVATVSFAGVKGTLTHLDLYRDLYYTPMIDTNSPPSLQMSARQQSSPKLRWMEDPDREGREWTYVAQIPKGQFLMMGDNSPSSSDGRVWGFVPESELVGRASFVWWPPSRWRFIK